MSDPWKLDLPAIGPSPASGIPGLTRIPLSGASLAMPIPLKRFCVRLLQAVAAACLVLVVRQTHETPALAADWHVATNGALDGLGNESAPWDIGSALEGRQKIEPGDTLWIHQGRYKAEPKVGGMGYVVRLAGRDGAPVQVRLWKGQRAVIVDDAAYPCC